MVVTDFQQGELVHWTEHRLDPCQRWVTRRGRVVGVSGDALIVQRSNGERLALPPARLRRHGENTELTDYFLGRAA